MLGATLGNYRITGKVADGGMGVVYRAEHTLIGRIAAVKILHPELSQNQSIVERFFNEARATTKIKHPGIVEVFDFGNLPTGQGYIVMEFLDGEPLAHAMRRRGRYSEGEAAVLMRGVCSALAAAHAKGIVHRDLKPDNIFVVPDPEAPVGYRTKILDFGIAKLTDIGLATSSTKTGAVMGTPTYMSPEQCKGTGKVDHRADLYSIGCILYELLAGRPPFMHTGAGELIGAHLFMQPEPLSWHAQLTPELEALVMALLAKDPAQRVQTAAELASHLVRIAQVAGWVAMSHAEAIRQSIAYIDAPMPTPTGAQAQALPATIPLNRGSTGIPVAQPTPAPSGPIEVDRSGSYSQRAGSHSLPTRAPMPTPSGAAHAPLPTPAHAGAVAPIPTSPPTPTTLSGAASQTSEAMPVRRSRVGLWIALGSAVAAAIVGTLVLLTSTPRDQPSSTPNDLAAPPVEPPTAPAVPADAAIVLSIDAAEIAPAASDAPPASDAAPLDAGPRPDAAIEPDAAVPTAKPDRPKPDRPKPDRPRPDRPKPDRPKPNPDRPKPPGDLLETEI